MCKKLFLLCLVYAVPLFAGGTKPKKKPNVRRNVSLNEKWVSWKTARPDTITQGLLLNRIKKTQKIDLRKELGLSSKVYIPVRHMRGGVISEQISRAGGEMEMLNAYEFNPRTFFPIPFVEYADGALRSNIFSTKNVFKYLKATFPLLSQQLIIERLGNNNSYFSHYVETLFTKADNVLANGQYIYCITQDLEMMVYPALPINRETNLDEVYPEKYNEHTTGALFAIRDQVYLAFRSVSSEKFHENEFSDFVHGKLCNAENVLCAGEVLIRDGKIDVINDGSGHYFPKREDLYRAVKIYKTLYPEAFHEDFELSAFPDRDPKVLRAGYMNWTKFEKTLDPQYASSVECVKKRVLGDKQIEQYAQNPKARKVSIILKPTTSTLERLSFLKDLVQRYYEAQEERSLSSPSMNDVEKRFQTVAQGLRTSEVFKTNTEAEKRLEDFLKNHEDPRRKRRFMLQGKQLINGTRAQIEALKEKIVTLTKILQTMVSLRDIDLVESLKKLEFHSLTRKMDFLSQIFYVICGWEKPETLESYVEYLKAPTNNQESTVNIQSAYDDFMAVIKWEVGAREEKIKKQYEEREALILTSIRQAEMLKIQEEIARHDEHLCALFERGCPLIDYVEPRVEYKPNRPKKINATQAEDAVYNYIKGIELELEDEECPEMLKNLVEHLEELQNKETEERKANAVNGMRTFGYHVRALVYKLHQAEAMVKERCQIVGMNEVFKSIKNFVENAEVTLRQEENSASEDENSEVSDNSYEEPFVRALKTSEKTHFYRNFARAIADNTIDLEAGILPETSQEKWEICANSLFDLRTSTDDFLPTMQERYTKIKQIIDKNMRPLQNHIVRLLANCFIETGTKEEAFELSFCKRLKLLECMEQAINEQQKDIWCYKKELEQTPSPQVYEKVNKVLNILINQKLKQAEKQEEEIIEKMAILNIQDKA